MKLVIYLTKNKVYFAGKSADWMGANLLSVFKEIRNDERVKDVRIVLGDEISCVASFPMEEGMTREKIEFVTRGYVPFPIENGCFDFKVVTSNKGSWIQVAAIERGLLEIISKAVWESGLSVELMIPIGALLGERTYGRDVPYLIRWKGPESLSILAANGVTDSVYGGGFSDEEIKRYAREKWKMESDPQEVDWDTKSFDVTTEVFRERNRGNDVEVLSIPVLAKKEMVIGGPVTDKKPGVVIESMVERKKKISGTLVLLLAILVMALVGMVFVFWSQNRVNNQMKSSAVKNESAGVVEKPTPTPNELSVTPQTATADFSKLSVQVLNGTGITGESGRVRDALLAKGFVNVDIGNATAQIGTTIDQKAGLIPEALASAMDSLGGYKVGSIGLLTTTEKYDLVIVLGSSKK